MQTISTIGLDIAKSVFQVHGVDAAGQVVVRRQLKRRHILAFFQKLPPAFPHPDSGACVIRIQEGLIICRHSEAVRVKGRMTMNRIAAGLVMVGVVATCLDIVSALAEANKPDPRLVWPKNSQFTCRGVLVQEQGTFRLAPDQSMLAWCDADIDDKDKGRVLDACKLGDRCEIKGIIGGHGAFGWVEITSITGIAGAARLPEAYLGATSASAEQRQECKGILRQDQNGLSFQIPPEGLCEINRSQEAKVLATCRPGRFCRVYGVVEDCKDSGECAEIMRVLSARRR